MPFVETTLHLKSSRMFCQFLANVSNIFLFSSNVLICLTRISSTNTKFENNFVSMSRFVGFHQKSADISMEEVRYGFLFSRSITRDSSGSKTQNIRRLRNHRNPYGESHSAAEDVSDLVGTCAHGQIVSRSFGHHHCFTYE